MTKNFLFYSIVILASLSGLLSGYDTGVISGALLFIGKTFELTPELSGLLVSSVSLGAIFGALINGVLIDRYGRKNILILASLIFLVGAVACALSLNIYYLIFSRCLIGFGVGIVSFAGPLYLSEISVKHNRGRVVSFFQVAITFGILFSYVISFFCATHVHSWRLMFLLGALPALILLVGMLFQNDTPRWYILKGRVEKAKKVLQYTNPNIDLENEVENIKSTISNPEGRFIFDSRLVKPLVIGVGIMFVQIATGINAIIYYAPTIFKNVGFNSNQDALFITIFIGLINFLMTFVAIAFVDKGGRKPLLYIGLSGMLLSLLALSSAFAFEVAFLNYLAIIACAIYIVSFSMSLGPIALLLISEIFPLRYRGQAMSVAIFSNFSFNFLVTFLFPVFMAKLGSSVTFLVLAVICVISLLFVYFVVPETKGLSLEEIEKSWVGDKISQ